MAISRKPKPPANGPSAIDIEALIAKGGSVAESDPSALPTPNGSVKETTSFTLRVPSDLLQALDEHRRAQPYKVPRQQWILEAIVQRLEREILTLRDESNPHPA